MFFSTNPTVCITNKSLFLSGTLLIWDLLAVEYVEFKQLIVILFNKNPVLYNLNFFNIQ